MRMERRGVQKWRSDEKKRKARSAPEEGNNEGEGETHREWVE